MTRGRERAQLLEVIAYLAAARDESVTLHVFAPDFSVRSVGLAIRELEARAWRIRVRNDGTIEATSSLGTVLPLFDALEVERRLRAHLLGQEGRP